MALRARLIDDMLVVCLVLWKKKDRQSVGKAVGRALITLILSSNHGANRKIKRTDRFEILGKWKTQGTQSETQSSASWVHSSSPMMMIGHAQGSIVSIIQIPQNWKENREKQTMIKIKIVKWYVKMRVQPKEMCSSENYWARRALSTPATPTQPACLCRCRWLCLASTSCGKGGKNSMLPASKKYVPTACEQRFIMLYISWMCRGAVPACLPGWLCVCFLGKPWHTHTHKRCTS